MNVNTNDFLIFELGNNIVRIISGPHQIWGHYVKNEIIKCSKFYGSCPICDNSQFNNPNKTRFIVEVIDRKTNSVKLMSFGQNVFKCIKNIHLNCEYGDPIYYDLNITITNQEEIYVVPSIPKPLSSGDQVLIENYRSSFSDTVINKYTIPPTYEEVEKQLKYLLENDKTHCSHCLEV